MHRLQQSKIANVAVHRLMHANAPFAFSDRCYTRTGATRALGCLILGLSLTGLPGFAADPVTFTDDFEGGTLNSFWTTTLQNGTITLETSEVHAGSQAALFNSTGGGQKELDLTHTFSMPQYGRVSTWVYDYKDGIYFTLFAPADYSRLNGHPI